MIVHYVRYLYPGVFVSETSEKKIKERDIKLVTKNAPKGAYAFQFYDIQEQKVKVGDDAGEILRGKPKNYTGMHFLGGDVLTLEVIKAKADPKDRILISNMEGNGWPMVVKTRFGQCLPFEERDVLVDLETFKVAQKGRNAPRKI